MKYVIMFALLMPLSVFANDGSDNSQIHVQNVAGDESPSPALNLSDDASDSLLWTYPTLTYPVRGSYLVGTYYPYYFGTYYYPYSLAYPSDFYGVPCHGHFMGMHKHHMHMHKDMDK